LAVRLPISCENLQTFGDITDDTDDPIEMPMARGHFFAIFDDTKRCIDVPLHVVFGVEVPQIGRNGAWRKMWGGPAIREDATYRCEKHVSAEYNRNLVGGLEHFFSIYWA